MLDNCKNTFHGRVKNVRKHKSCAFIDIDTKDGVMQLCFGQDLVNKVPMRGDIISATGIMSKTRTGQDTLFVEELNIINSSQNPDLIDFSMKDLILERTAAENAIRVIMNQNNIAIDFAVEDEKELETNGNSIIFVAENEKSIAYSLTFNDYKKTLTDEEINNIFEKIITNVENKCGVKLRK